MGQLLSPATLRHLPSALHTSCYLLRLPAIHQLLFTNRPLPSTRAGWAAGLDRLCILSTIQAERPFTVAVLPVVPRSISAGAQAGLAAACSHMFAAAPTRADASPEATVARAIAVAAARVAAAARAAGHNVVQLDQAPDVRKAVTVSHTDLAQVFLRFDDYLRIAGLRLPRRLSFPCSVGNAVASALLSSTAAPSCAGRVPLPLATGCLQAGCRRSSHRGRGRAGVQLRHSQGHEGRFAGQTGKPGGRGAAPARRARQRCCCRCIWRSCTSRRHARSAFEVSSGMWWLRL